MEFEKLKERLHGVVGLLATPFTQNMEIDEEGLRENTRFYLEKGVHVFVPNGSCGECYAMTVQEQKRVMEIVVDEANGKVPVYCGASHSSTKIAIELSKYAQDVGAEGVQVVQPYYFPPMTTGEDLLNHYKMIGDAIDIGIIIYNNPTVGKIDITSTKYCHRFAEIENIVGIKDASHDMRLFNRTIRMLGHRLAILCGTGEFLAPYCYLMGSPGHYSSFANFAPELSLEMYEAAMKRDFEKTMDILFKLSPLVDFLIEHLPFPRVIKGAMNLVGRPSGPVRPPLIPLNREEMKNLRKILIDLGVLSR